MWKKHDQRSVIRFHKWEKANYEQLFKNEAIKSSKHLNEIHERRSGFLIITFTADNSNLGIYSGMAPKVEILLNLTEKVRGVSE